jgi:hypothetical protein
MRIAGRTIGLTTLLVPALALGIWYAQPHAQTPQVGLARPGEDPRPLTARLIDPLPLPVTGDVQITGSTPLRVTAETPVPVHVVNASAGAELPPFIEAGRCYQIDFTGQGLDAVWRVEQVAGTWLRAQRLGDAAATAAGRVWVNASRVVRLAEVARCQ